jgi:hypothetical protein
MFDVSQLSREAAMLFRHILVALVVAAIAGVVVVPFVIGYVRGPQAGQAPGSLVSASG